MTKNEFKNVTPEAIEHYLTNRTSFEGGIAQQDINLLEREHKLLQEAIKQHKDIFFYYTETSRELNLLSEIVGEQYLPAPKNPEIDAFILDPIKQIQNALYWGFIYGLRGNISVSKQQLRFAKEASFWLVYWMDISNRKGYQTKIRDIIKNTSSDDEADEEVRKMNIAMEKDELPQYCESVCPGATKNLEKYVKRIVNPLFAHFSSRTLHNLEKEIRHDNKQVAVIDNFDSPEIRKMLLPENILIYSLLESQIYHLLYSALIKEFPNDQKIRKYEATANLLKEYSDEIYENYLKTEEIYKNYLNK